MHVQINYGISGTTGLDLAEGRFVGLRRPPLAAPLLDPAETLRTALETPVDFPALRRALTPDDEVTIVVDLQVPKLPILTEVVLDHVMTAGVRPERITLIAGPDIQSSAWPVALPSKYAPVRQSMHDPNDRKQLAYLASTRKGRRVYLNRRLVEADQLVVISSRRYDPLLGHAGNEGAIFPALSDGPTRSELAEKLCTEGPGKTSGPVWREAEEVCWLLGAPFMVQIIEGSGDEICHIVAGTGQSGPEALQLMNNRWRAEANRAANLVVATLTGSADRHTLTELGLAMACASRVVEPGGKIAILCQARPTWESAFDLLKNAESPDAALRAIHRQDLPGRLGASLWANAALAATIYVLSGMDADLVEDLFAVAMDDASQLQKVATSTANCLVLEDAHKMLAALNTSYIQGSPEKSD